MAVIDLSNFDTQHKPMSAVSEVMNDFMDGCLTYREALGIIYAIDCEWRS